MKKTSFLIVGKHAVTEALKNPNRVVLKVFLTEDSKKTLNKENQNLDLLKNMKLFYKTKKELDRLCSKEQISHQGLIAEIEHVEENNLKDFINYNADKKKVTLSIKAMEEKQTEEAVKKYGSKDSGGVLGEILGPLLKKKPKKNK